MVVDPQYVSVARFGSWLVYMAQHGFVLQVSLGYNGATVLTDIGNFHRFIFEEVPPTQWGPEGSDY